MKIVSVSEAVGRIQWLLEGDPVLSNLWVRGEISNFRSAGGHWYFTVKDSQSALRVVMFRSRISRVGFLPHNGLRVVIRGYVSVFERDGGLTLYADEMKADGIGALWVAFQEMKDKLEVEGLFDPARKRPLPKFPRVVGIVTSPTGAAFQDLKTIIHRRCPITRILLSPATVQGSQAPGEITAALSQLEKRPEVEVIIIGRGGGSLEELWAFNTEEVARAVSRCPKPIISAVGHETDTSISDLVADVRAATPSAAAEMVVPVLKDLEMQLDRLRLRMGAALRQLLRRKGEKLAAFRGRGVLQSPRGFIDLRKKELKQLAARLQNGMGWTLKSKREKLARLASGLSSLSPLAILSRGYAICRKAGQTQVIVSSQQAGVGDQVEVLLGQGSLLCQVEERKDERTAV